jgi:poly(A) polymerase
MMESLDRAAIAELLTRPNLKCLLEVLNGDGEETRIVGGAIRNALVGKPVHEVDLAGTALPETVTARAKAAGLKAVPTGIEHGTITVIVDGEPFEVTTLREDVETDGRHAVVRFGRDFARDARRRDFTINALSLSLDGTLHDVVGGVADLRERRVRFIGDAITRIREDYLRILRFFRFHAEYATSDPDPVGLHAAVIERRGLLRLSAERVRAEIMKLLVAERAAETLRILSDHGFLLLLLGGVTNEGRFVRVRDGERSLAADPVRRLAALAIHVTEDAERLRERLRLSNEEYRRLRAFAALVARLKDMRGELDERGMRSLVAEAGLETVTDALFAVAGEPRPVLPEQARRAFDDLRNGREPLPLFPLRGADLVAAGIAKGPDVGKRLERARRTWLAQGCPTGEGVRSSLLALALAGPDSRIDSP